MGFRNGSETPELINLQALPSKKEVAMKTAMQRMCHKTCKEEQVQAHYYTNNETIEERVGRGP